MKFGKHIQAQQVPGWSAYYLDYKFLKKIISSLAANRPASEATALIFGIRPPDPLASSLLPRLVSQNSVPVIEDSPGQPPIFSASGHDDERGPTFQAHKAAFFFKLERELEKINSFYLQKEAALKLRMETLLSKRRAAAMRGLPDTSGDVTQIHVEWSAVEEGFRLLERDLGKLQQFVEVNATGFRKILKKYDKHSKSTTKELYLARQVDVQPVFNRQLISELADTVATCLLDVTDLSSGLKFEGPGANDILVQQIMDEHTPPSGPFRDLENNFHKAVATGDRTGIMDCVHYANILGQQNGGKQNVTRILWNVIIEAPPDLADLIMSSLSPAFDYHFVDDINGRTCLHEAAIAGALRLVDICVANAVPVDKTDAYGRTALHYACMYGHPTICRRLLAANIPPDTFDRDNYSPLVYSTLKGNVECVRVLLEEGPVTIQSSAPLGDLIPLSLACQSGHVDVVLLLLQKGAKCFPNSSGEFPMHLAAREGHVEVCKLLLHLDGWDSPDKYHEWTPLFHAARYGRADCVDILISAGSRVLFKDELGHFPAHYAAWYGHQMCLSLLIKAMENSPSAPNLLSISDKSPMSDVGMAAESEIDMIPMLALPPPIMPHRVYGHNYLDRSHLVQVKVGNLARGRDKAGVRLHHRLISPAFKDEYLLASTPLKLVMTTSAQVNSAPYSISLPQNDEKGIFTFQISSVDALTLEFSIYPNFGTKTIGRAVALPSLFSSIDDCQTYTLPILDHRLHIVGEVDFDLSIITSFEGFQLEVGGGFETYWKSTAVSLTPLPQLSSQREDRRPQFLGSAGTSPSAHSISHIGTQALTISSLQGQFIYVVVQVTRDLHPVVYSDWLLPGTDFDLGVADVTLAQFEALSLRLGRNLNELLLPNQGWENIVTKSMLSLSQLLKILPLDVSICLELAYPSSMARNQLPMGHQLNLNVFVDSILRTIFNDSASHIRRRILLTSFSPNVCSALNWKQPNYPVFFAAHCGKRADLLPSRTAYGFGRDDTRVSSVGAAVDFAKVNNLLGIFVDAELLMQVPSLIHGIKNAGLLVGVHGASDKFPDTTLYSDTDGSSVDAFIGAGMVAFTNHSLKELV